MPEFEYEAPSVQPAPTHDAEKPAQTDHSKPDNSIQSGRQISPRAPHPGPVVEYSPPQRPPGSRRKREPARSHQSRPKESFRTQRRELEERRSTTRDRSRGYKNKTKKFPPRKRPGLWSRIFSYFRSLFGGPSKKSKHGRPYHHRRNRRRRNRNRRYNDQNNPRFSGRSSSRRQPSEDDRRDQSSGRSGGSRRRSRGRRPRNPGISQDSKGQSRDH